MPETRRTRRLNALIQAELSSLLLRKVKDPRLKLVSITGVDVSPDLRQAKVFFSPMDEHKKQEVEQAFKSAASFLRRELASNLQLKIMPRLFPVYDDSMVRGAAMSDYIEQVRQKDRELNPAGEDDEL